MTLSGILNYTIALLVLEKYLDKPLPSTTFRAVALHCIPFVVELGTYIVLCDAAVTFFTRPSDTMEPSYACGCTGAHGQIHTYCKAHADAIHALSTQTTTDKLQKQALADQIVLINVRIVMGTDPRH
jgi:hypothetical protein